MQSRILFYDIDDEYSINKTINQSFRRFGTARSQIIQKRKIQDCRGARIAQVA